MSSQLIIPGLFKEVYVAGSRHSAGAPELIRSNVDDDNTVSFEWKAVGSSVYTIIAKGSVTIVGWDVHGHPKFDSFEVECSCPDGERQRTISQQRGKLYVCKHAKAALDSVVDPNGKANFEAQKRGHMEEATRQKRLQEEELPGERARIEHGLSKRSADEIVTIIKERVMTVEGLEALVTLFPPDVMPAKTTQKCGRCKKEYDPNIQSELICRLEHPFDRVRTEWDGSKKSWSHCRRCDKTFGLDGFHSWGKRRRNDPVEEGDYCFEGKHVPEEGYDESTDPVMLDMNDGDY